MSRDERSMRSASASDVIGSQTSGGFGLVPHAESICFGCSMLSRIRPQPRLHKALATMRCSLGYALRSAEDVARCLAVEGPGDCWKTAPSWRVSELGLADHRSAAAGTHVVTLGQAGRSRGTRRVNAGEPCDLAGDAIADGVVEPSERAVEVVQIHARTGTDDGGE